MDNKKLVYIIVGLVVYIVSAFASYLFLSSSPMMRQSSTKIVASQPKQVNSLSALAFDNSQPRTQACPINGVMYTQAQQDWWMKHRPLGVMIENSMDARPQSGISYADVTYEAVAEGGITRTLNVFYCQDAGIIGPVRSARTYFLDYISEYADFPLYAHVGGANTPGPADAIGQIGDYGWVGYNDMDQFGIGYPTYWRDETRQGHPVATEHTMYSTTSKLWAIGDSRGLTNITKKTGTSWDQTFVKYNFKSDSPAVKPTASSITVPFWNDPDYIVVWKYDNTSNSYLRSNGGSVHLDRDTKKQLTAKDIIVMYETQQSANDGYENNLHNLYGTTTKGNADIFMDGKKISATWKKATRTSRTLFYDANGAQIQFNRGHMWFEIVPLDQNLTVK